MRTMLAAILLTATSVGAFAAAPEGASYPR